MGGILVVNSGSSSLRVGLFDAAASRRLWSAAAERIGAPGSTLKIADADGRVLHEGPGARSHTEARDAVLAAACARAEARAPSVIGHRIVHGGEEHTAPLLLTPESEARLRALAPLAPLHMPDNLAGIDAARRVWPSSPQAACFDTMFHRTLPERARLIALPKAFRDAGVRRYGFHGLSYEHVVGVLQDESVDLVRERIIVAHLGAGSSMCAISNGESVETTMGFSTLSGLPMASRCGDIDPDAVLHLLIERGLDARAVRGLLYSQSGLAALAGSGGDMKELLARRRESGDAALAFDFYCYQAARQAAGLAAALGGLDRVVFTGGVGFNAPAVRGGICAGLRFLGVEIDDERNSRGARRISSDASAVTVEILQTDEEAVIARHACALLAAS